VTGVYFWLSTRRDFHRPLATGVNTSGLWMLLSEATSFAEVRAVIATSRAAARDGDWALFTSMCSTSFAA
jgi:hypothetical protein